MDSGKKVIFIKNWILNYVNSMPKKAESLVIGISGGVDSSVSSTLSAMTGLKTNRFINADKTKKCATRSKFETSRMVKKKFSKC